MRTEFQVTFEKGQAVHIDGGYAYTLQCELWDGKEGILILETKGKGKSNYQNRYFRGVLLPHFLVALQEAGYREINSLEDALVVLKHFHFKVERRVGKTNIVDYLSTRNQDWETGEWELKMSEIRDWCWDKLNYVIPMPNEENYNA